MTKTAVDYTLGVKKIEADKQINDAKNYLTAKGIDVSEKELEEAIRHNKVNEMLESKKADASVMSGVGSILRGLGGFAGPLTSMALGAVNDESYHNKLAIAYEQATKLPFNWRAGNTHPINDLPQSKIVEVQDYDEALGAVNSGIIEVKYASTIPLSPEQIETSELQNNVRLLYTPVRQANSGAVNQYDQSDLFQFVFASSGAFEIFRLIVRPLNFLNAKRKDMNTFTAWDKTVLTVMCGSEANANFVINNRTDIVQAINSRIRSYNSQALPIGFDLTKRRSLLNGRIFCHDKNKDEIYIFNPINYFVYDEANAQVVSKDFYPQNVFSSIDNILQVLDEMILPLVNGTTTSIMAGDLQKAYPRQVATIRQIPYTLKGDIYSMDEHILEALRNADVVGTGFYGNAGVFTIKQGVNSNLDTYIYAGSLDKNNTPYYGEDGPGSFDDQLVDLMSDDTDYADAVKAFAAAYPYSSSIDVSKGYSNGTLLDVKTDNPAPYDIMAGTRFKVKSRVQVDVNEEGVAPWYDVYTFITQCATEIIVLVRPHVFYTDQDYKINKVDYLVGVPTNNLPLWYSYDPNRIFLSTIYQFYARFHYLPQSYSKMLALFTVGNESTALSYKSHFMHSLYNYREITDIELLHLNTASFGSLITTLPAKQEDVE